MKRLIAIFLFGALVNVELVSQNINTKLILSEDLKIGLKESEKVSLSNSIQDFFKQIKDKKLNANLIGKQNSDLSMSCFRSLSGMTFKDKKDTIGLFHGDIINCYPIKKDHYYTSMSYERVTALNEPEVKLIYSFIIEQRGSDFVFSIPLEYHTRHWKQEKVGNITYYYRGQLNRTRAEAFDKKNILIANKFGLEPEPLNFYMTENYQEVNRLLGFDFELSNAGRTRDGYGVDANTIFAIQNNEDFSHDIFHYYSSKVNKRMDRNWVTEEGLAYLWGNAYYTDSEGEMIDQDLLVKEFKKYLKENPKADILDLFVENKKIFTDIAPEPKARSVISGILCEKIEQKYGMEGLQKMINAGARERMKKYFIVLEELLEINRDNFHVEVLKLVNGS